MSSTTRYIRLVGAILLLIGILIGGWGMYQDHTYSCQSGYLLSVEQRTANATGGDIVTYANLSASEQRAFKRALNGTETIYESTDPIDDLNGKIVVYRGDQYDVYMLAQDCGAPGLIAKLWGIALVAGGIISLAIAQLVDWWRGTRITSPS